MRKLGHAVLLLGCAWVLGAAGADVSWDSLLGQGIRPRRLVYKTVADTPLAIEVYDAEPSAPRPRPRPVILMIHGGGWEHPGPELLEPHCRYFAGRGMVAMSVAYRLVGDDAPTRIGDCIADVRDAVRFIRREAEPLGIDPRRVAVAGDSAGGHLAAALALLPDPDDGAVSAVPDALILLNPVLDLSALGWMARHGALAPGPATPADETWDDRARHYSPLSHVRKGMPPSLLIHGDRDDVVPIEQADRFAALMRQQGNRIEYRRMPGWPHAFAIDGYGTESQIVETLRRMDAFLGGRGFVEGKPTLIGEWQPPEWHPVFSAAERRRPHVRARSHDLRFWPFLDGQWLGIVNDPDGYTWFSFSTHSGTEHAQLFRYDPRADRVEHVADLGQVCGEKLTGHPPQDKIHGDMFLAGDTILAGTCEGHAIPGNPYRGGYWLKIDRHTGVVTSLGKSISEDGLLCVGYDSIRRRLYGHSNRKGWLTRLDLDPAFNPLKEHFLGIPWQDVLDDWAASDDPDKPKTIWPRGLSMMITGDGRVIGAKPPPGTFWMADPDTGAITTFEVAMPLPAELEALAAAGKEPDARTRRQWRDSSFHLSRWDETDQCFYLIRSFDQMLCRFHPPDGDQPARLETLHEMGLTTRRYGLRPASCVLAISGRKVYYTPHTGWGGVTHLTRYDLERDEFTDLGPIVVEGGRRVNECHAMVAAADGKLHLAAFVFSKPGTRDPVTPWAMRDRYPFHSRFVIIDLATDADPGMPPPSPVP